MKYNSTFAHVQVGDYFFHRNRYVNYKGIDFHIINVQESCIICLLESGLSFHVFQCKQCRELESTHPVYNFNDEVLILDKEMFTV